MSIEIAVYRTDDYVQQGDRRPILPLLKEFFEPLLGRSLDGCQWHLRFLPVTDTVE